MLSLFRLALTLTWLIPASGLAETSPDGVKAHMKRAARYFHQSVSRHGGYVYYYSPDLKKRLGEGVAGQDQIWVQAPGTPAVGMAYLKAFQATKDPFYLKAARDAARALIYGQLASGGWTNSIDFDTRSEKRARYRNGKGRKNGRNFSTLDDGITQGALEFLILLDRETGFQDPEIHEATKFALMSLLRAQFPNGAFPQGWDETLRQPASGISKRGNFPRYDWRTEGRIKEFWDCYNLNDGIAPTVTRTLILAHEVYQRDDCLKALKRFGDFLILAQMPHPQPAWAQQYNDEMHPIWARKFEPPAIAGRESEGVIQALLRIAHHTREARYLKPIPDALAYLKSSELPNQKLARYYELRTNKPLFMSRKGKSYSLTYDDSNLPSHYGWITPSRTAPLQKSYDLLISEKRLFEVILPAQENELQVESLLAELDDEGRWLSTFQGEPLVGQPRFRKGEIYLSSGVFCRNLQFLSLSLGTGK